jgi:hypothetical protein
MGTTLYRPTQWSDPNTPGLIMLDFPGQGTAPQYAPTGIGATLPTTPTRYIFDCVILADHDQRLRKTEHPVQTSSAVSDHAFIEPATLSLDVGMSDAMDAYNPSFLGQNPSKSVAAYQTMVLLMFSRIPLTITTRLRTYENMIVEHVHPQETFKTRSGLRMRIEFGQVFRAQVQTTQASARGQDTQTNNLGSVTTTQPTDAQRARNSISGAQNIPAVPTNCPGAGPWTSGDVCSLQGLPAK